MKPDPSNEESQVGRRHFEEACAVVYEPLQRYLRRRASAEDAEEALDDVLLAIWRRLPAVPSDALVPWSYGVARRVLANQRRAAGRRRRLVERILSNSWPAVVEVAPGDDAVVGALSRMRESDRELLRLWAWERLEPREMAVVLDVSPNAVSARLSRAKKRLESELLRQDRRSPGHLGHGHTESIEP
jgi:RNA polymerase sigma-70 factor (ECF subfamily)